MRQSPPPTQAELDHLFKIFKDHLDECPGFEPSDHAALEEIAKIWKAITIIRRVGAWLWRLTVRLGELLIKAGAVLTVVLYLLQQWKVFSK